MKNRYLCLLAVAAVLDGPAMRAAPDNSGLQQAAAGQEQIRGEAQLLVARLDEVIADYTRNGLASGDDFETLKAVREAIGSLSDDEMEQVVGLLKGADGDREQMAKAFAGQKDISLRLKQILAAHQIVLDLDTLANGVRQLADRQSANLSVAGDTAQLAAQDKSANGQAAVTASEQAQQSEQGEIAAEIRLIADKLDRLDTEQKYQPLVTELELAQPGAVTASDALGDGKLDDAVTAEKVVYKQLDEVARALAPKANQTDQGGASSSQAASAAQALQQLQKGLAELTAQETASVQQGDALKTGTAAGPATELQQSLAAKAQALEQAAAAMASPGAQALQQAADALQSAAQDMAGGMATQAETAQQMALQNLTQAAQQLAQEASAIAQKQQDFANMEKQMAGLDKVIQQQQQLLNFNTETAADQAKAKQLARTQAGVQKNTEDVRQAANPDAAKALDQADAAMGNAAQQLNGPGGPKQAEQSQKAALAALYQAQDALADQMQQAAQDLGQSSAQDRALAMAALAKAQAAAASAQGAMASGESAADAMRSALPQLAKGEGMMGQAASQPQAAPQAARDAMREAEQALSDSAVAAEAGQNQQAQAQAAQASQAMEAAQSALGEAQAGIAGIAPGTAPANDGQQSNKMGPGPNPGTTQAASGASEKNWNDQGGAAKAAANGAHGPGEFQGLPDRDRAAIQQSQSEKYPQEYGSMIEEYMRNLASDTEGK